MVVVWSHSNPFNEVFLKRIIGGHFLLVAIERSAILHDFKMAKLPSYDHTYADLAG